MGFFGKLFGKKSNNKSYSTELERVRALYGTEADALIKYWSAFYYLKVQARELGNNPMLEQMRKGLQEALKQQAGQSTFNKVMKFGTNINEDKLAKELDIINAIENDETGKFRWF